MREIDWEDDAIGDRPYEGDWESYVDIHPLTRLRELETNPMCRHGEPRKECAVCHLYEEDSR